MKPTEMLRLTFKWANLPASLREKSAHSNLKRDDREISSPECRAQHRVLRMYSLVFGRHGHPIGYHSNKVGGGLSEKNTVKKCALRQAKSKHLAICVTITKFIHRIEGGGRG
jgi:hypothetical protein